MITVEPRTPDIDREAQTVFLEAIELLGGPRGLVERRRLTWLPSLMEAAYAVVLAERHHWSADEIAAFLGLSRQAVRQMLTAPPERVRERLFGPEGEDEGRRPHIAGGLARLAFERLQARADDTGGSDKDQPPSS